MLGLHVGHNYCQDLLVLSVQPFPVTAIRCIPAALAPSLWLRLDRKAGAPHPYWKRVLEAGLYCSVGSSREHRQWRDETGLRSDTAGKAKDE